MLLSSILLSPFKWDKWVACRQFQLFSYGPYSMVWVKCWTGLESGRFNQRRVDKDYLTRPVTRAVAMDSPTNANRISNENYKSRQKIRRCFEITWKGKDWGTSPLKEMGWRRMGAKHLPNPIGSDPRHSPNRMGDQSNTIHLIAKRHIETEDKQTNDRFFFFFFMHTIKNAK